MFFNESMLFKVRAGEIADLVDFIVVVESLVTFTGIDRETFLFQDVYDSLPESIRKKIRYIRLTRADYPESIMGDPWLVEEFTRNQIRRGLQDMGILDYVIIGDVDEIPNPEVVRNNKLGSLRMLVSNFKFNLVATNEFITAPKAVCGLDVFLSTPNRIRFKEKCLVSTIIPRGGWHFSFIMDDLSILTKLSAFSHQEFDGIGVKSLAYVQNCIEKGIDLFQRPNIKFQAVGLELMPATIAENVIEYAEFIQQPAPDSGR